jgi:hypothetical protein
LRSFIQGLQCWIDSRLETTKVSSGKIW